MDNIRNKVIKSIQDEWETISYYNDLIDDLEADGDYDGVDVIDDINSEEHTHVGQLQSLLQTMGGDLDAIEEGEEEGEEQLDEARSKNPELWDLTFLDSGYCSRDEWLTVKKEQIGKYKSKYPKVNCFLVKTDTPGLRMWVTAVPKEDSINESLEDNRMENDFEKQINEFIEESRGYTDYDGIVQGVADEFDLSKEDAEQYVWNYMYTIGHDVNTMYDESLNKGKNLKEAITTFNSNEDWVNYLAKKLDLDAYEAEMLEHDLNNLRAYEWIDYMKSKKVPKDVVNKFVQFFGLNEELHNDYEVDADAVNDYEVDDDSNNDYPYIEESLKESFDPYSLKGYNYDDHEIEVGINYCKENNIDINTLNDYDFENIVILANKYYASKPDWKYTDDEILAGLNLLYDEGAMLSNLDADGVEYYIKKANNIEECYKMTNKEIKEALNKLDMWAIDNDTTFHDLKTLYEAFVNPNSPVDQKKKEKIQKALNDPNLNKDKEKLQDYIAGVLSRKEESLEETLEDDDEFDEFTSQHPEYNKKFDKKRFGKFFDKNGKLIPEKKRDFWQEYDKGTIKEGFNPDSEDDINILYDIADRYCSSYPVSGRWDDETEHELQDIMDTFDVSRIKAIQIMQDFLGFEDEQLYDVE